MGGQGSGASALHLSPQRNPQGSAHAHCCSPRGVQVLLHPQPRARSVLTLNHPPQLRRPTAGSCPAVLSTSTRPSRPPQPDPAVDPGGRGGTGARTPAATPEPELCHRRRGPACPGRGPAGPREVRVGGGTPVRMDQRPLPGEWADLLRAPPWSGQQSGPVWVSWAALAGHFISIAHPSTLLRGC